MQKYILPSLLILACAAGVALGQTITRFSNDPSGAIGVDSNASVYFIRHVLNNDPRPPVLSTCGGSPTIVGNDMVGKITTGSAATTCTVTFALAFAVAPACIVAPQGTATYPTFTTSTTAMTFSVDIASTVYSYICMSTG